ncbi:Arabinose 5-phosphate isomerase [Actinomycetales bacterium JB111]|nr:Arabinose 5-phosphate isomerase [Actinomycetales bacterium JB111]
MAAAKHLITQEIQALVRMGEVILPGIEQAARLVRSRRGKVVVSGLGKSGLIGAKIAATLASTGTSAHFVHAADALHGDSGAVSSEDVALLISNSGTTAEVCRFASMLGGWGVPVIAMTGDAGSTLARAAAVVLDISVPGEADPLGLAPTSSSLVTLAAGDALAACLMTTAGFTAADFGARHPGGALGERTAPTRDSALGSGAASTAEHPAPRDPAAATLAEGAR